MFANLNFLHLLIVLGAAGCVRLAATEAAGRSVRPLRLFATPALALATAAILLLFALNQSLPREIWVGALVVGLIIGAVRGATMAILVDQVWGRVRLPNGRHTLWIALALALAVAHEVAIAILGNVVAPWHIFAPALSALCAGMLAGRATAVAVRIPHAPNDEPNMP